MPPSGRTKPSILIVDDDKYVLDVVAASLRGIGARLFEARTAADALAVAEGQPLTLAIVDIGLPEGGDYGYRLAADLRARQAELHGGHDLRVIVLTGQTTDPVALEAAGIAAAVGKPFSLVDFRAVVSHHLATAAEAR